MSLHNNSNDTPILKIPLLQRILAFAARTEAPRPKPRWHFFMPVRPDALDFTRVIQLSHVTSLWRDTIQCYGAGIFSCALPKDRVRFIEFFFRLCYLQTVEVWLLEAVLRVWVIERKQRAASIIKKLRSACGGTALHALAFSFNPAMTPEQRQRRVDALQLILTHCPGVDVNIRAGVETNGNGNWRRRGQAFVASASSRSHHMQLNKFFELPSGKIPQRSRQFTQSALHMAIDSGADVEFIKLLATAPGWQPWATNTKLDYISGLRAAVRAVRPDVVQALLVDCKVLHHKESGVGVELQTAIDEAFHAALVPDTRTPSDTANQFTILMIALHQASSTPSGGGSTPNFRKPDAEQFLRGLLSRFSTNDLWGNEPRRCTDQVFIQLFQLLTGPIGGASIDRCISSQLNPSKPPSPTLAGLLDRHENTVLQILPQILGALSPTTKSEFYQNTLRNDDVHSLRLFLSHEPEAWNGEEGPLFVDGEVTSISQAAAAASASSDSEDQRLPSFAPKRRFNFWLDLVSYLDLASYGDGSSGCARGLFAVLEPSNQGVFRKKSTVAILKTLLEFVPPGYKPTFADNVSFFDGGNVLHRVCGARNCCDDVLRWAYRFVKDSAVPGINVNATDNGGKTPLQRAVQVQNHEVVRFLVLITEGVNVEGVDPKVIQSLRADAPSVARLG